MSPTKGTSAAIAVTIGVWIAGVASAAGLAYVLRTPVPSESVEQGAYAVPSTGERMAEPPHQREVVLEVPTVVIVGHPPWRAVAAPKTTETKAAETKLPNIMDMRCADWRPLDMGSGRVRVCEPPPTRPSWLGPGS